MFETNHKSNPYADRVYALTRYDVQKISAILSSAREAVSELLEHRCFDFTDECDNFPREESFYNLSSSVLRDCESERDYPF